MNKLKVMISQPMRGKTNEQIRNEREELIRLLKINDYEVIDTIVSQKPPLGINEPIYYLSKSIEFISNVDIILFMNGWENARGCKIEHEICKEYGKKIIYEKNLLNSIYGKLLTEGNFVRLLDGTIGKYEIIQDINYVKTKNNLIAFNIETDVKNYSKNIVDLIQIGDYVNDFKVYRKDGQVIIIKDYLNCERGIEIENIRTIATKEQFKLIEYEV